MDARTDTTALVLDCERRIINAWPAPVTLLVGDWVLRLANGYSGRANSASAIAPGAELDPAMLAQIEALYRAEGLPACIRLTPLIGERTRAAVIARGYRVKDASFGMIAELSGLDAGAEPALRIEPRPSRDWCAGVAARQTGAKTHVGNLTAIVGNIRMPAAFATLLIDGEPVGYGMCVAERGMAEIGAIVVDAGYRGQGLGRRLVQGLMAWARDAGCDYAYLQVEQGNAVAINLYDRLGFRRLYAYETRILD